MVNLRKCYLCKGITCLFAVGIVLYLNMGYLFEKHKTFIYKRVIETINDGKREFGSLSQIKLDLRDDFEKLVKISTRSKCLACFPNANTSKYREYPYFTDKYSLNVPPMDSWVRRKNVRTFCDNRVKVYNNLFAILHDVKLDPSRRRGIENQAKGGEEIRDVLNQKLDREDYMFNSDFLEMECFDRSNVGTRASKITLLKSLMLVPINRNRSQYVFTSSVEKFVIAVRRQDYANLHNWVRNIYNTFVIMMHFKIQPINISVLFMDGHPHTELDKSWEAIYGTPLRVGQMSHQVQYQNLILGLEENQGPITEFENSWVPYLEEFRSFVLSQFGLDPASQLDCTNLRITVILRRNAVYHPRNAEGKVGRKIFNEAELVNNLMKAFPRACVKPSLMEALPMAAQLDIIRQTDILIGMHGAGMSHVTFLPKHAAVLELFSKGFKIHRPWFVCFHSITKWRNMTYDSWENFDISREMPADFTILPTHVIVNKTMGIFRKICPV